MLSFLTFPFDVIKTNRILQTQFAKEGGESLVREYLTLFERGGL